MDGKVARAGWMHALSWNQDHDLDMTGSGHGFRHSHPLAQVQLDPVGTASMW
jgi:hypothetical protein